MHIQKFIVEALKGESGTYVRFGLAEALGVTWTDSYPTGYGFSEKMASNAVFNKGPFSQVFIQGRDEVPAVDAQLRISPRMSPADHPITLIAGGTVLTILGKQDKRRFGSSS